MEKDVHALRARTDDAVLEKLDRQVAELQGAHDTAQQALDAAKATRDAIHTELRVAIAQRDTFRQVILDQRTSSRARRPPNLPVEVLANCFEQHCWTNHPFNLSLAANPDGGPNADLAKAPFALAAVCQRWRSIALATPSLWSYIGLPDPAEQDSPASAAWLAYVLAVIDRSGSFPLAIVLDWQHTFGVEKRSDCTAIVDAIASQTLRWRHMRLAVQSFQVIWGDLLRNPTPQLRVLNCHCVDSSAQWSTPYPRYLPVTPKLELLRIGWFPVLPSGPIPVLGTAHLWMTSPPATIVWNLLSRASQLVSLLLGAKPSQITNFVPYTISLDELTNLYLRSSSVAFFSTHSSHLRLPNLETLTCTAPQLSQLEPFLQECGGGVVDFTVYKGSLDVSATATLKLLGKVDSLRIDECTIASGFWDACMAEGELVLPLLRTLRFSMVELDPNHDGLPRFLRARHAHPRTRSQDGDGAVVQRLHNVYFDKVGTLPNWFVAEVKYIMTEKVAVPKLVQGRRWLADRFTVI